jgi:hypothetical protein
MAVVTEGGLDLSSKEIERISIEYWISYYTLQLATTEMSERDTAWTEQRLATFTAARLELTAQPVHA